MKRLECTPKMALDALYQNQRDGLERWICLDAVNAQTLLIIVRGLMSANPTEIAVAQGLAQPWIEETP